MVSPLEWTGRGLRLLDQTVLPAETAWITCRTVEDVARGIAEMRVRGAPAIGVSAAYGMALAAQAAAGNGPEVFGQELEQAAGLLCAARPTAVNLAWAVDRMLSTLRSAPEADVAQRVALLEREAAAIHREDVEINKAIGRAALELVPARARILTHCNAGALATADYGTALGVVRAAVEAGRDVHVWVDETRPFLQGARLTAWELMEDSIPCTLICDNMAGFLMSRGEVDLIVVGADRIAANGDTANKIGTYALSRLAESHGIPFYIAAPLSTFDAAAPSGDDIPIEERAPEELTTVRGLSIAPEGVKVWNPAFDVTPARYITGIITENGVIRRPDREKVTGFLARWQDPDKETA